MKICSISLTIKELQMDALMRCYYKPIRISEIKNTIPNAGKDVEKLDVSYTAGGNVKWGSHSGEVAVS